MNKDDFLIAIEANLSEYPEPWVEEIIKKYSIIFDNESSKGFTEDTIIEKLGDPFLVAQKCKQEGYIPPVKEKPEEAINIRHSFKEESNNIKLEEASTIIPSSKSFLQKTFKFLSFIVFLVISLPLFSFLLFLFSISLVVFLSGFAISLGVFAVPTYIDYINLIPKGLVIFGGLGTIALGISIAIGGILLLRLNIRFIKNLTNKISEPIADKRKATPVNNTRLIKPFAFFIGLTLIFFGILFMVIISYQ